MCVNRVNLSAFDFLCGSSLLWCASQLPDSFRGASVLGAPLYSEV